MSRLVPYDKEGKIWVQEANVPKPPKASDPRPEKPPPHIPGPTEPAPASQHKFTCSICKKAFSTQTDLDLHLEADHKSRGIQHQM